MRVSTLFKQYVFGSLSLILLIGLGVHFWIFRQTIHHTADETLEEYEMAVKEYARKKDTLISAYELGVKEGRLNYLPPSPTKDSESFLRDTMMLDPRNGKYRKYRILNFPLDVAGKQYRTEIALRTLGNHDHFLATLFSYICVLGLLGLFVLLLFHFFSHRILSPFTGFMEELRRTDLKHPQRVTFSPTQIDEINELHESYQIMLERIHKDYQTMKELSDNISHELQTPLAIMRSKVDLLLQKNEKDESCVQLLQSVQSNINRLSRFNRSLMLLTRIVNHTDAKRVARVNLGDLCEMKLDDYAEMLEMKGIRAVLCLHAPFDPLMNEPLAEVLINNLLSNAMKYNVLSGGFIRVITEKDHFMIENPYQIPLPEGDLFERFVKNKHESDATGLGLAIVKAICEKFSLVPVWETEDSLFRIRILYKNGC